MMGSFLLVLLSLSLGSFANNVISYFTGTSKFDIVKSRCLCGSRSLGIKENIPLISFFVLKGRCLECKEKIPVRYIAVEIFFLVMAIVSYLKYDITINFAINYLVFCILIIIAGVDKSILKIPNPLVLILFLITLVKIICVPQAALLASIISSIALLSFLLVLDLLAVKYLKKHGIGMGDIKLLTILNLFLGFPLGLIALWVSSVIAIFSTIVSGRTAHNAVKIKFGIYICIGFIMTTIFDNYLISFLNMYIW